MIGTGVAEQEALLTYELPVIDTSQSSSPSHVRIEDLEKSRLLYKDFWPACLRADEGFNYVEYERFDTLFPRVNAWLRDHIQLDIIKCETLTKRISSPEQITNTDPKFDVPDSSVPVWHVRGLRIWYSTDPQQFSSKPAKTHASQIGYRNYVPRCLEIPHKHPVLEDLSATYNRVNEDLMDKALEGHIVSVETVGLHIARQDWDISNLQVDQTAWLDSAKFHVIYITRIFYVFECPAYEQVGAADFLPERAVLEDGSLSSTFLDFSTVMDKVNSWLGKVKDIRITNLQTLEAAFPGMDRADHVNTSCNFVPKADTVPLIRFVRVAYVRPKYGLPPGGLRGPKVLTYRTFVPVVTEEDGGKEWGVEYEPLTSHWERVKAWMTHISTRVIGCEVVWHPLPLLAKKKDRGEVTFIKGTWCFPSNMSDQVKDNLQRVPMVQIFRVYFEGGYEEPAQASLPAPPVKRRQKQQCALM